MAGALQELLASLGIEANSEKAKEIVGRLSAAAKAEAEAAKEAASAKKEGNETKVIGLAEKLRESIEGAVREADLLPRSVLNFTARVSAEGVLAVTANNCASGGTMERIHVTDTGIVTRGEAGAEVAKNKRPRRK